MVFAMLYDLIRGTRSFRRFKEKEPVHMDTLRDLVNLARIGGSARNVQPLKYILVNNPAINARIFPHLLWAGYLKDWPGPGEGERPAALVTKFNRHQAYVLFGFLISGLLASATILIYTLVRVG